MELIKKIPRPSWAAQLDVHQGVVFSGSCFSDHIGSKFDHIPIQSFRQPQGVVFHPSPLLRGIGNIARSDYDNQPMVQVEGGMASLMHHGSFTSATSALLLDRVNAASNRAKRVLEQPNAWLFLTLGTAWGYKHREHQIIAANCHRLPANQFQKELATVDEITGEFNAMHSALLEFNPSLNVVISVSPVRHVKDGYTENHIGKSRLLEAALEVCLHQQVHYFPAYELVLDELRDYRFYNHRDRIHPNEEAVEYVWQVLRKVAFTPTMNTFLDEWEKLANRLNHRPNQLNSSAYTKFEQETARLKIAFGERWDLELS